MDTTAAATTPRLPRAAADDRRHGDRHRLDIPVTLTADPPAGDPATHQAGPIAAVVTAYSVNGVGLRVGRPLAAGDVYAVATFDSLIPPGLRVRVRSVRPTPAGDHEVGAEVA